MPRGRRGRGARRRPRGRPGAGCRAPGFGGARARRDGHRPTGARGRPRGQGTGPGRGRGVRRPRRASARRARLIRERALGWLPQARGGASLLPSRQGPLRRAPLLRGPRAARPGGRPRRRARRRAGAPRMDRVRARQLPRGDHRLQDRAPPPAWLGGALRWPRVEPAPARPVRARRRRVPRFAGARPRLHRCGDRPRHGRIRAEPLRGGARAAHTGAPGARGRGR